MTSPVIQFLNGKFPEAKIDFVTDKRSKDLYVNIPFQGKLFDKNKDGFLRGAPHLMMQLLKIKYDIIVDVRTDGLAYLLRGKKKYTKWNNKNKKNHVVENLMGVVEELNDKKQIPHTKIWLQESNRKFANDILKKFDAGKILAVSVGDIRRPVKSWEAGKFIELFNRHVNDFRGIVFLGNFLDMERTEEVMNQLKLPCLSTIGRGLLDAAAIIEKCSIFLGPDSGLGHVASAMMTPTISLFSVDRPERCRPWGNKVKCICGLDDDARNISVDEVSSAVKDFLKE